jgi:hypothetical protein
MPILHSLVVVSLALAVSLGAVENTGQTDVRSVILLDHSESGGHGLSRQYLRGALIRLSSQHGFRLQMTNDPSAIDERTLASAQVLILSNGDGDVIPPGAPREAVENFVKRDGKGLILVHAATAFLKDWTFLGEAVVQPYYRHNEGGTRGVVFADSGLPGDLNHGVNNPETRAFYEGLPRSFPMTEEYYSFRESPRKTPGVNVLFSLDESSVRNVASATGDHPLVWTRKMGNGIVVTQTLGHGKGFFTGADSFGQKLLWNEIRYAAGEFLACVEGSPCQNSATPIVEGAEGFSTKISVVKGSLRVSLGEPREYAVRIVGTNGKTVFSERMQGPRKGAEIASLKAGTYLIHIKAGGFRLSRKVTLY